MFFQLFFGFQGLVELARHAGDHAIGMAGNDHGSGKRIAVQVDQAIDVALEVAFALEARIKQL